MAIYMKIDGVKGSSTDDHHKDWIELLSMNYQIKKGVTNKIGYKSDRQVGLPYIGEMIINKPYDKSSYFLFQKTLDNTSIPEVTINLCHTGNGSQQNRQYVLNNVIVSYFEEISHGDANAHGTEYIRLNFTQIEKRDTAYDALGKPEAPKSVTYNLAKAEIA